MKKYLNLQILCPLFLALCTFAVKADTFFDDTFTTSTLNQSVVPVTPTSTSYQTYVGLVGPQSSIAPGNMTLAFPMGGCVGEVMGLFTNNAIPLTQPGDHVELDITFINITNVQSGFDTANATLNIGMYNSGGALPNQGNIQMNTGSASGGTQGWVGYIARAFFGGNSGVITRPAQTANGSTSQNQDLLFSNASSSQAFQAPAGANVQSATAVTIQLTQGETYTEQLVCTLTNTGFITISNSIYLGTSTAGTPVFSIARTASGGTLLAGGFDGFAFGWRNTPGGSGTQFTNVMQITHISVTGFSTPVSGPPIINTQPVPISVPLGSAGGYTVTATGFNVTYQWRRNGTNLIDGGNISGAHTSTLQIFPVGASDVQSSLTGYSVLVGGAGGFSTNSVTNSLTLGIATNLIYTSTGGNNWDINTTSNWKDTNGFAQMFNFGDPVLFDDTATVKAPVISAPFLSPASITMNNNLLYKFTGNGSIAGPTTMLVEGGGPIQMSAANSYTGGTIISNATAVFILQNLAGLGNGPTYLSKAGVTLEVTPTGSAASGIPGDIIVQDDATMQIDGVGTFAGVVFGGLYGTPGKTLKLEPGEVGAFGPTTNRFRFYGTNTSMDANIVIDDIDGFVAQANLYGTALATYNSSGSQTYNGVISGTGGYIQRGSLAIFNGANTYTGGATPSTGMIGLGSDTVGSVTSGPIGTGPLWVTPEVPNTTGSGGIMAFNGARTIANHIEYPSGTNNQTLIIGGTNDLTLSGSVTLNGDDGATTFTNRTITVTNLGLTTISGVISDGGANFGLTKNGAGVLSLANTETYTGPTFAAGGSLRINGALPSSYVMVTNGGALGGTGTIAGPVTISTNGVLAPGNSIGILTVNNNLTLNGNMFIEVNKAGSPTSDKTVVSGTLANTGTGTVTVTNLGAALAANDRFVLFNKAVTGGATLSVSGASVTWSNGLAIDGSITVLSTTPITSTNITVTTTGNSITMSWPAAYLGWSLQSNSVSITATNSWFTVPGSSSTTSVTVNYDKTKTNVFYRMSLP